MCGWGRVKGGIVEGGEAEIPGREGAVGIKLKIVIKIIRMRLVLDPT